MEFDVSELSYIKRKTEPKGSAKVLSRGGYATYKEIKDYVYERYGLKISSLYISQVKNKCGIPTGKCFNNPKNKKTRVLHCPKHKENAITDALVHFRMI